jgi:hypothetical protein
MALDVLSRLSEMSQSAVARLVVRSALNPLLWMSVTIALVCFGAAFLFKDDKFVKYLLVLVGSAPIILTCAVAGYFALRKPEKLQSEDYQLRHQTLNIIKEKGGRVTVDSVALEEIANPTPTAAPVEERQVPFDKQLPSPGADS